MLLQRDKGDKFLLNTILDNLCEELNQVNARVHYICADFPMRTMIKGRLGHTSNFGCEVNECLRLDGKKSWAVDNVKFSGIQRTYSKSIEIKRKLLRLGKEKVCATSTNYKDFIGETCR